jgi:hypothetical protein
VKFLLFFKLLLPLLASAGRDPHFRLQGRGGLPPTVKT